MHDEDDHIHPPQSLPPASHGFRHQRHAIQQQQPQPVQSRLPRVDGLRGGRDVGLSGLVCPPGQRRKHAQGLPPEAQESALGEAAGTRRAKRCVVCSGFKVLFWLDWFWAGYHLHHHRNWMLMTEYMTNRGSESRHCILPGLIACCALETDSTLDGSVFVHLHIYV